MRKLIADVLRVFVGVLDPPIKADAKEEPKTSVPLKPGSVDDLPKPASAIELHDTSWDRSFGGNYL